MKHYMIGISGFSGSGKDTVADALINKFQAQRIGLVDSAKRHMADLYGFTEEQLFGPSEYRNAGDLRYLKYSDLDLIKCSHNEIGTTFVDDIDLGRQPIQLALNKTYYSFYNDEPLDCMPYYLPYEITRNKRIYYVEEGDANFWLSPREALQKYCELMSTMYLNTWVKKSIADQIEFARKYPFCKYTGMYGITDSAFPVPAMFTAPSYVITCSPDFRHKHDIKLLRESEQGDILPVLIRVIRPSIPKPPYPHKSEVAQASIPDSVFDFILNNNGSIADLHVKTESMMQQVLESGHPKETIFL